MKNKEMLKVDVAVVGGGMSGISTAITCARQGLTVCLMTDRPVLGGNASSEVRMWIRGASAHFPYYKEGGLCEEIALDNAFYNPEMTYPKWDMVLLNKVLAEKNITLLMNTFCVGAKAKNRVIKQVNAIQTTTYTDYLVEADFFVDCSGDAIFSEFLPISYMLGREDRSLFKENAGKDIADKMTMGNSCLFSLREIDHKVDFIPPKFAKKLTDEEFYHRMSSDRKNGFLQDNFWWIELGGEKDSLHDAEEIKYELLAYVYGIFDYIKNSGRYDADYYDLDFVGFYPAKRESKRYIGIYTLTQNDIENATNFFDEVAYGGWSMDDHNPFGIRKGGNPNVYYPVKQPYGIPLRALISRDYDNLGFAGRNISVTHMALSSTRVMATCMAEGQAIGIAVSLAKNKKIKLPNTLDFIKPIQQQLRDIDCFLLNTKRNFSETIFTSKNNLTDYNKKVFFDGIERCLDKNLKPVELSLDESLEFTFDNQFIDRIRLVFDSDLARECQKDIQLKQYPSKFHIQKNDEKAILSPKITKEYELFVKTSDGWKLLLQEKNNYHRLNIINVNKEIGGIRFIGKKTHGFDKICIFSIDVL